MKRAFYVLVGPIVLVVVLTLLTVFGPWDTYRVPQKCSDGMGGCVGVVDLPVWAGEILRYTSGATTQKEGSGINIDVDIDF
jgi:hypothetical protein